jgi:hypothetical protein
MAKEVRAALIGLAVGIVGSVLGAALISLFNDHTAQAVLEQRVKHLEQAQTYYHGDRPDALK